MRLSSLNMHSQQFSLDSRLKNNDLASLKAGPGSSPMEPTHKSSRSASEVLSRTQNAPGDGPKTTSPRPGGAFALWGANTNDMDDFLEEGSNDTADDSGAVKEKKPVIKKKAQSLMVSSGKALSSLRMPTGENRAPKETKL